MSAIGKPNGTTLGARRRRRALALAALFLVPAVVLELGNLAIPVSPSGAMRDGAAIAGEDGLADAVAQWQALWAELDTAGSAALDPRARGELADPSLRAAGDTVFMRYRNLWGAVDASARRAFQLAALSHEPAIKLALLQPLTNDPEPRVRLRAHLEQARIHLRARDFAAAEEAARAALAVPDLDRRFYADAQVALAQVALETGDPDRAEAALGAAIAADPGYWDARQLYLPTLARQLGQRGQSNTQCLRRTQALLEQLGALPALAADRAQFRDLADRFAAIGGSGTAANPALALLAGLGYLWVGDPDNAGRAFDLAASARASLLPERCQDLIARQASLWRARLDSR